MAGKGRQGPESLFNRALAAKFVDIVRRGNFRETACAQVGIDSRTLRIWLRKAAAGDDRYTQFVKDIDAAEAEAEAVMVVAIRKAALKDWRAAAWYLERRGAKRWGFKAQVELSVQDEISRILDVVEQQLGSEAAARIFGALSDDEVVWRASAGPAETGADSGPAISVHPTTHAAERIAES